MNVTFPLLDLCIARCAFHLFNVYLKLNYLNSEKNYLFNVKFLQFQSFIYYFETENVFHVLFNINFKCCTNFNSVLQAKFNIRL